MPRRARHRLWLAASAAALVGAAAVVALTTPWLLPAVVAGPTIALILAQRGWRTSECLLEEVSAERARLDRLAQEGEELVARVSRELRVPLTPIRGFATALARRGDAVAPDVRRRALEEIADRAVRMSRLVDDLLVTGDGSCDDGGDQRKLSVAPIDLQVEVRRVLQLFRTSHPHRTFEMAATVPVPQAQGDPAAVEQVVIALLSNACRYSPPSSPVTVHVGSGDPAGVQVAVTDRGPGIPRSERERIFERFHRLRRPEDPGGLGLGLYVARCLTEAMTGSLDVDSYEGDGSTFTLSLPVARHQARRFDTLEASS